MSEYERRHGHEHDHAAGAVGTAGRAGGGRTTRDLPRTSSDVSEGESRTSGASGGSAFYPMPAMARDGSSDREGPPSFVDSLVSPPVQMRSVASNEGADAQELAAPAVASSSERLPFLDVIQASFGDHDVSGVQAHTNSTAQAAAREMGAQAFATGDHVAFAGTPDLHTTAHEAAHVVQQRNGVHLKGGVGQAGDEYERHADAVADAVVRGESAAPLLAPIGSTAPTRAIQRKDDNDRLPEQVRSTEDQEMVNLMMRELQVAEDDAEKVWRDVSAETQEPAAGCARLTEILRRSHAPVVLLGSLFAKHTHGEGAVAAGRESVNPFKIGAADRTASDLAPFALAVERARPEVFDSLNNLVRISLQTMRRTAPGAEMQSLASMVDTLSHRAVPLGWTRPDSLEAANARRFEHEACPDGAMDERPEACTMTDGERVDHRNMIRDQIKSIVDWFFVACEKQRKALQGIIDADRNFGQVVGGVAIDLLVGWATGGGGKGLQHVAKLGTKLGTQGNGGGGGGGGFQEERTLDALASLKAGFAQAMQDLGSVLAEFDDRTLRDTHHALALVTRDVVKDRVDAFVKAYRAQIEPIGSEDRLFAQSQPSDWRDLPARVTIRAARIHPLRGEPRMALVRHVTDAVPAIRAAGRGARDAAGVVSHVGGEALAGRASGVSTGPAKTDSAEPATKPATDKWATSSGEPARLTAGADVDAEQFIFMRWIDDEMAPLAEAEAIDVSSAVVQGLAWTDRLIPPSKER